MKVWLDDVRKTPSGFTDRAYTAKQAIELLKTGQVEFISLDHDLGEACHWCGVVSHNGVYSGTSCIKSVCTCDCHMTGYDVALWIESQAEEGNIKVPDWVCHSANPEGKRRIEVAMQSAERIEDKMKQGAREKDLCKCLVNSKQESHSCPFSAEIHGNDRDDYCECCDECRAECAADV